MTLCREQLQASPDRGGLLASADHDADVGHRTGSSHGESAASPPRREPVRRYHDALVNVPLLDASRNGTARLEPPRPSSSIFDIPIDLAQPPQLLRTISDWASERTTRRVMYVNAHV